MSAGVSGPAAALRPGHARTRECNRQVRGDRALADATLAAADRHNVLDPGNILFAHAMLAGSDAGGHIDLDLTNAFYAQDCLPGLLFHLFFYRTCGCCELNREGYLALIHAQILDEVKSDDILVEIRIFHLAQRVENALLQRR